MQQVRFPDGSLVRAVGLHERAVNAAWREHGLYLDARWAPTWPAEVVDWPDLSLPTETQAATTAIVRAHRLARTGVHVEIGCLAGRGRTGTVLACIAVLAGIAAGDAVTWVRRHHLPGAVETAAQEAWVTTFADRAARLDPPAVDTPGGAQ